MTNKEYLIRWIETTATEEDLLRLLAVIYGMTGEVAAADIGTHTNGTFKRVIKSLRQSQATADAEHATVYEMAVQYVRRSWLHRE